MKLFLTKDEALASGVDGEVCIGWLNIHGVHQLKDGVLRYIWTRTNWS